MPRLADIQNKRNERKRQIEMLNTKIQALEEDTMYSPEFKRDKINGFKAQLEAVRKQYDVEIKDLITKTKTQLTKMIDQEQYSNLKPEEVNKQLLIQMRNQGLATDMYDKWKSAGPSEAFVQEATHAIENNLSNAGAYVSVLRRLEYHGANELEEKHKFNNLTGIQKDLYKELKSIDVEAKAYEVDVVSETDPMKAAMMNHYLQNPEKGISPENI